MSRVDKSTAESQGADLKFLIAGFGSIGRRHFRNLLALGERDVVFYRTRQSTLSDDELASFPVETDLQAALAHRPDAVIVANPTALHLEVAIPAAEAGCHLLIEKPISHSMEGVDTLRASVNRTGSRVLTGFQLRFHPGLQRIAQLLAEGMIGSPLYARAHWGEYLPDWHPWEDYRRGYAARPDLGGGVALTLSHPLDYLHWLFGEVESLFAYTGHLSELELQVADVAEINLRFRQGMIASVHLNYFQQPSVHTLEIVGTQGTIRWNGADGAVWFYRVGREGDGWQTFPAPDGFERNWMFLSEMNHFIQVVRGDSQPICTLDDGFYALRLALVAEQASRNGQALQVTTKLL
jgi:predicted dehydrogenase